MKQASDCGRSKQKHAASPHAADDAGAFAEIDLGVAGRMGERDENLARPGARLADVILHDRIAAGKPVFDLRSSRASRAVCSRPHMHPNLPAPPRVAGSAFPTAGTPASP
jgi:hypothetical protein